MSVEKDHENSDSENDEKENTTQILTMDWIIGAHTSFTHGKICDTLKVGIKYGMTAIQFFMGSPMTYARAQISEQDLKESKKLLDRWNTHVFSHFPYCSNLGNPEQKNLPFLLKNLQYEISVLAQLGGGVVIHPGSNKNRKQGLELISKNINKLEFGSNGLLLLENCAGEKNKIGRDIDDLTEMLDNIDKSKRKNVCVCIDTCHLFSAGDYDIRKNTEIDRFFEEFDQKIGLKKLRLIHLNDSKREFGCCVDRHACLGTGEIWGESFDSLIYLLSIVHSLKVPCVLETHGVDMLTLGYLAQQASQKK